MNKKSATGGDQQTAPKLSYEQQKSRPFADPVYYREWSQTIDRVWRPMLSKVHYVLVRFIFDRTAGWGKEWERVPIRHLTQGVIGGTGVCYAGALYSCPRSAREGLSMLVNAGVLLRVRKDGGRAYYYSLNYEWNPSDMKTPKRLLNRENNGGGFAPSEGGKTHPQRAQKPTSIISKPKRITSSKTNQESAGADLSERRKELDAAFARVARSSSEARMRHKAKGVFARKDGTGLVPAHSALCKAWQDLHNVHFADCPCSAMSAGHVEAVRKYAREWTRRHASGEFMDYLAWLFEAWPGIRVRQFAWMQNCPKAPEMQIVATAKLRVHLEAAYRDRELLDEWRKMTPAEREARALVVERGMDPKVAAEIVGRRHQVEADTGALEKARRMAALERQRLERERAVVAVVRKRTLPVANEPRPAVESSFAAWDDEHGEN